jgi:hypothetical protein
VPNSAREVASIPPPTGCRRTSSVRRVSSDNTSGEGTPFRLSETSPESGMHRSPSSPPLLIVRCGNRSGARRMPGYGSLSRRDVLQVRVFSLGSVIASVGRNVGTRLANIFLPCRMYMPRIPRPFCRRNRENTTHTKSDARCWLSPLSIGDDENGHHFTCPWGPIIGDALISTCDSRGTSGRKHWQGNWPIE